MWKEPLGCVHYRHANEPYKVGEATNRSTKVPDKTLLQTNRLTIRAHSLCRNCQPEIPVCNHGELFRAVMRHCFPQREALHQPIGPCHLITSAGMCCGSPFVLSMVMVWSNFSTLIGICPHETVDYSLVLRRRLNAQVFGSMDL